MSLLAKSKLIAFHQCPKRLWLEVHHPELREYSAGTLASFQVGHQVGDVARRIYDSDGTGTVIDVKTEGYERAFVRSKQLLAESRQPIFEAGFKAGGALAFADVMLPETENGHRAWKMVEVKSSTSVKDYHREDVAVQTFIAQSAGVDLKSVGCRAPMTRPNKAGWRVLALAAGRAFSALSFQGRDHEPRQFRKENRDDAAIVAPHHVVGALES